MTSTPADQEHSADSDLPRRVPETGQYLAGFKLAGLSQRTQVGDQATRHRLLVAAVKLFADRGYESCSMRELAAEVGVKAPAIYNHFSSKSDVLTTAVDYVLSDFLTTVLTGLENFPESQRLFELLRRHATYKTRDVALSRAQDQLVDAAFLHRVLPADSIELYTAALAGYRAIIRDLLIAAQPRVLDDADVSVPVLVSALIEMVDQVSSWFRPDGTLSGDEIANQCVVIARRMVLV